MVRGGITNVDRTQIVILKGNFNAEWYVDKIIQPVVPFVERHHNHGQ